MKKYLAYNILFILFNGYLFSQTPQVFNYQTIVRDNTGNILTNRDISLKISMIQDKLEGKEVYLETHQAKSNPFGLINLLIGKGNPMKGNFTKINWGEESYSIRIEMDINGGNNFKLLGTSDLYSVPYALYAENAGELLLPANSQESGSNNIKNKGPGSRDNSTPNSKTPANGNSFLNVNIGNVGVGTTTPQEKLDVTEKITSSEGYNSNGLDGITDTLNIIIANDYENEKLKYITYAFNGGLVSYISNESAWVDSVGNYLLTSWECGDSLFDPRDSTYYQTVLIGTQCWMAENLNIGARVNGINDQTDNDEIEKYCYNDSEDSCNIYGGLYQWNEMMLYSSSEGSQGICPVGWHIPTDQEWKTLEGTVDTQYSIGDPEWDGINWRGNDAGGNLKELGLSHWDSPNAGATNSSGYTALPGGFRKFSDGSFLNNRLYGYFWTSTEFDGSNIYTWSRILKNTQTKINRSNDGPKTIGQSLRCLMDCSPWPSQANAGSDQLNLQDTVTILAGDTPEYGTGVWAIISGTGGVVADTSNSTSSFSGLTGNSYDLTWTISTICGSSSDTVTISFANSGSFTCGDILIDSRDSKEYNTVLIGSQCWMAENLNVGTKIDGVNDQTDNSVIEKYCYNDSEDSCNVYGGLYQWNEMMQYVSDTGAQGICPDGWYIPTDQEWKTLEGTVDTEYPVGDTEWDDIEWRGYDAGDHLKSTSGWYLDGNGSDTYGFTTLPGGFRHFNGTFAYIVQYTRFWSSTADESPDAWSRRLYHDHDDILRYANDIESGYSVRCIKGIN